MKIEQRCTTPKCVERIKKYGEPSHRMYSVEKGPAFMPNANARCEGCGGYYRGNEVKHTCQTCGDDVPPGKLVGLFVPHNCAACQDALRAKERSAGWVCRTCRNVHSECYC